MNELEKQASRQIMAKEDLVSYNGGIIMPFLLTRAVYKTLQVIEKAVDWLTTDHKE